MIAVLALVVVMVTDCPERIDHLTAEVVEAEALVTEALESANSAAEATWDRFLDQLAARQRIARYVYGAATGPVEEPFWWSDLTPAEQAEVSLDGRRSTWWADWERYYIAPIDRLYKTLMEPADAAAVDAREALATARAVCASQLSSEGS